MKSVQPSPIPPLTGDVNRWSRDLIVYIEKHLKDHFYDIQSFTASDSETAGDYWSRSGTTLSPTNTGDDVNLGTASLTCGSGIITTITSNSATITSASIPTLTSTTITCGSLTATTINATDIYGHLHANNEIITDVATPVAGTDGVNKDYVDAADNILETAIDGKANRELDNLRNVAINESLTPGTSNAIDLGGIRTISGIDTEFYWRDLYIANTVKGNLIPKIDNTYQIGEYNNRRWSLVCGHILKAEANGLIWSDGTTGTTPASGAGTRFMWIPAKVAFRCGSVSGVQWDNANIGTYSVAMGNGCQASGTGAIAIGQACQAFGNASVVLGQNSDAGIVGGAAGSEGAVAIGSNATAEGKTSVAIGGDSTANGDWSTAIGNHNSATGVYSACFGYYNETSGNYSSTLGARNTAQGWGQTVIGTFATISGTSATRVDADAIFKIGNGVDGTPSDCYYIDWNGNSVQRGNLVLGSARAAGVDYTLTLGGQTSDGVLTWLEDEKTLRLGSTGSGLWLNGTTGDTPTSGIGTRLMWIPAKGAFRAGNVGAVSGTTNWDDTNIGLYSFAITDDSIASGRASVCLGEECRALANYSFVAGDASNSAGNTSVCWGDSAYAAGAHSIAIGWTINSFGLAAIALGSGGNLTAAGDYSIAIGDSLTSGYRARIFTVVANNVTITISGDVTTEYTNGDTVCIIPTTPAYTASTTKTIVSVPAFGGVNTTFDINSAIDTTTTGGRMADTSKGQYAISIGQNFNNATANSIAFGFNGIDLRITEGSANFQDTNLLTTGTLGAGNTTIDGIQIIDVTNAEAFLVRQNADAADVFRVDTTNKVVGINYSGALTNTGLACYKTNSTSAYGVYGEATANAYSNAKGNTVTALDGLYFTANYAPAAAMAGNVIINYQRGIELGLTVANLAGDTKNITVTELSGLAMPTISLTTIATSTGTITATNAYGVKLSNPVLTAGGGAVAITTLYGFYDPGMTVGGTNWGFYGLSAANYLSGSLDAGSYKVGGAAGATGTFVTADVPAKTVTVTSGIITSIV